MTTPQEPAPTPYAASLTSRDEPLSNEQATAAISEWLNQRLRVSIFDQRVFEGWFKCIDKDANIVLSASEEFRDGSALLFGLIRRTQSLGGTDSHPWKTCAERGTYPSLQPQQLRPKA
jgi:small nuclear ribonucleoprotein (snRNP)-like protein